jgi:hypothetical protein
MMRTIVRRFILTFIVVAAIVAPLISFAPKTEANNTFSDPAAGEVFKEFAFTKKSSLNPYKPLHNTTRSWISYLDLGDNLNGAVRAEISVGFWGGHINTLDKSLSVNGHDWLPLPLPQTPPRPENYFMTLMGRPSIPVPLDQLKTGKNAIKFRGGPQEGTGSFNWPHYIVYDFVVRIYYDPAKMEHSEGRIASLQSGDRIGDNPVLTFQPESADSNISQVDFIGYYEDFDYAGDGNFRKWQYQLDRDGNMAFHIGTATAPSYSVTWDTTWVPDQDEQIKIMARVRDKNGVYYMTPVIDGLTLVRDRSVKMYKLTELPKSFSVRNGKTMRASFNIPDDVRQAIAAKMTLSTFSGSHGNAIELNGVKLAERVGLEDDYSVDDLQVPVEALSTGANVFSIFSNNLGHAIEMNWPGPVIKVQYPTPSTDGISILFNGTPLPVRERPFQEAGYLFVPLREVFEAAGMSVSWEEVTRSITGSQEGKSVKLEVGSTFVEVNGEVKELSPAPKIVDDIAFVPLEAAVQYSGLQIEWDESTNTVILKSN